MKKNSAIGDKWTDWEAGVFTPEEDAACELRVALIGEIIKARKESGLSQSELGRRSGIKQPAISRLESFDNPRLDTLLRVLAPLGKTLVIAPVGDVTHG